jgi:hypothetical protein
MNFEDFKMPFVGYISEKKSKSEEERTLYYLGGEPIRTEREKKLKTIID